MYFDFEDYHPDIVPVGRAISWREGLLLSIIVHLAMIILLIVSPRLFPDNGAAAARARQLALAQREEARRFVFVAPRLDTPAPKPPIRGEDSDKDRDGRTAQRAPKPSNPLPFARGNSPERVQAEPPQVARGQGPAPETQAGQPTQQPDQPPDSVPKPTESQSALEMPTPKPTASQNGAGGRATLGGGSLGDALRNLQRYVQTFDNAQGGSGPFGPEIQFDTKGVEFGPWIRRFVAQVKRNWPIPYNAMLGTKGHVVITFNVHKDGAITDLSIAGPCNVDSFNTAAYGALVASNPTYSLPEEYPSDKAFFTVTFFYNENPAQ